MNRNVAPANQKNRGDAVEVGPVEETDESTDETEKEIDLTPGALSRIDDPVRPVSYTHLTLPTILLV